MSAPNFIYEWRTLSGSKVDLEPLALSDNPVNYLTADGDHAPLMQALDDTRRAIISGTLFGFSRQDNTPTAASGSNDNLFVTGSTGDLYFSKAGTLIKITAGSAVNAAGSGLTLAQSYAVGAAQTDNTILIDSTRSGLFIRDNASPISGSLLSVQSSDGSVRFLDVTATASLILRSGMVDGAAAISLIVDTTSTWSNTTAKLLSVRNNGSEKFYVSHLGDVVAPGGSFGIADTEAIGTYSALYITTLYHRMYLNSGLLYDFNTTGITPGVDGAYTLGNVSKRFSEGWFSGNVSVGGILSVPTQWIELLPGASGGIYSNASNDGFALTADGFAVSITGGVGLGPHSDNDQVFGSDSFRWKEGVFTDVKTGHLIGTGGTPTIVAGAALGSGPTVSVTGTDSGHKLNMLAGTGTAGGLTATVTFARAYAVAPRSIVATAAASAAGYYMWDAYITNITTTGYEMRSTGSPNASNQNDFYVVVIQ